MSHLDMRHLNGDILCAVSMKTTGPNPADHDIVEVCVLPLDANLRYSKSYMPFLLTLKPRYPENADKAWIAKKCNKPLSEYIVRGMDYFQAATLFDTWFGKLERRHNKRIQPLAFDWSETKPFLVDWLGYQHVEDYFDWRARSIVSCALMDNDNACFRANPYPLPKVDLQYLCSKLKVPRDNPKEALDTAKTLSEVYKKLIYQ